MSEITIHFESEEKDYKGQHEIMKALVEQKRLTKQELFLLFLNLPDNDSGFYITQSVFDTIDGLYAYANSHKNKINVAPLRNERENLIP